MGRELRNGDLVRVRSEHLSPGLRSSLRCQGGLLGLVIDDIDAHEEVQLYHVDVDEDMQLQWWTVDTLELVSDGGEKSYGHRNLLRYAG